MKRGSRDIADVGLPGGPSSRSLDGDLLAGLPELRWYWRYVLSLGLMLAAGTLVVLAFRRRGWIGAHGAETPGEPWREG